MADYTLPDLPYDYAALEPHISGRIMELHHDKHHAAYVAGANAALEKMAEARESGSFEKFQAHFTAAALGVQGSGWAALVYDSIGQRPIIVQFHDQQQDFPIGTVPLLLLDVWEHAYYLDYQNVRADYIKAFWNIANWADVERRFTAAQKQTSGLLVP